MSDEQPLPKVKHQSKMDAETFLKHMNARHVPAAGVSHFGKSNVIGDKGENLLRAMHDHLHAHPLYADTHHQKTHTHGEAEPE
jgi:hypothetical protein